MPYYKICYSVVQVRKFAPHLHHTMKSFAILHNFIDNYNILIIFAIYQQTAKYQCIYKRHKIAIFKYCPGHTKTKPQPIDNQLRFCFRFPQGVLIVTSHSSEDISEPGNPDITTIQLIISSTEAI